MKIVGFTLKGKTATDSGKGVIMYIKLSEEQINQILDFDRTKSLTTAANIARTLAEQVLSNYAKEFVEDDN